MSFVPKGYVKCKTTEAFGKDNIPDIYSQRHFTRSGVYGQIHVLKGQVKFYGYESKLSEANRELILNVNATAISHPEYWHKIEPISDDALFEIHFYCRPEVLGLTKP